MKFHQQKDLFNNDTFFDIQPTDSQQPKVRRFSYRQETIAMEHASDSIDILETLCNESKLQIKKILILCSEICEIVKTIPSVAENGKFVDMTSSLYPATVRMAALLDDYNADPSSVTQSDIQEDALRIANHVYG